MQGVRQPHRSKDDTAAYWSEEWGFQRGQEGPPGVPGKNTPPGPQS